MSFGLRMWGGDGSLQFDTSTATWKVVLSEIVSFDGVPASTKQFLLPGCNASNSIAFALPLNNETGSNQRNLQLETQMGDGVAYIRNYLGGYSGGPSISWATMRFIVMRWS